MQMPAVALFGAGNVAVGVLPPEASSEMKRNIYSTRFRFAVQLSDRGGSRIFIAEGLQVLGAPFWLLKGCQIFLEGAVMVRKAPFHARRAPLLAGGAPICFEGRRRGQQERHLLLEGRIRWREGTHIMPSVQKWTPD